MTETPRAVFAVTWVYPYTTITTLSLLDDVDDPTYIYDAAAELASEDTGIPVEVFESADQVQYERLED